jgi:hypothetical protein
VIATLRYGLARFRTGRGRTVLRACGIAAAGAMVGAAVTVAWGLSTGFDRAAARAQLPDAIATFDERPLGDVSDRVSALPNLRAAAYRLTVSGRHVEANGNDSGHATLIGVQPGPPGYALLRGRDLRADGQAVAYSRSSASASRPTPSRSHSRRGRVSGFATRTSRRSRERRRARSIRRCFGYAMRGSST